MNTDNKFAGLFESYRPIDKRSHSILTFFAEDLNDVEKIEYINEIFNYGSWILPTEISKLSNSENIKEITKGYFFNLFDQWVNERIEHSSILPSNSKVAYIPIVFTMQFREALISIRNLEFPKEIMQILDRFLSECSDVYAKKFLEDSVLAFIEEFNVDEIEVFLTYFLEKKSDRYVSFFYTVLSQLAYSYKIFILSDEFIDKLNVLSNSLANDNQKSNYQGLISILLIKYIVEKKLDLSKSDYVQQIENKLLEMNRGNHHSLVFYKFLRRFNYQFLNHDFQLELDTYFDNLQNNINLFNSHLKDENQKKSIAHHYIKSADEYFEFFLLLLEKSDANSLKANFSKFVRLIDSLRFSLLSLLWFYEYLNYEIIYGKIERVVQNGYSIKVDDRTWINKEVASTTIYKDDKDFIKQYKYGFLKKDSLRDIYRFFNLSISEGLQLEDKEIIGLPTNEELPFLISDANYAPANKYSVLILVPFNKTVYDKIRKFQIKSFFSSIEFFIIEKSYQFLSLAAPFQKRSNLFEKLFPLNVNSQYNVGFKETDFWEIVKDVRPHLYENIYQKFKKDEESFLILKEAYRMRKTIKGTVIYRTNGGLWVDVGGFETFLPGSQIDTKPILDYDDYLDMVMDFRVIKITEETRNVVVSHKVLVEEKNEALKQAFLLKLHVGQVLTGKVKNIISYGVFVDLGIIDGLIHITDLSWNRVSHPTEILNIGQTIEVQVIDYDADKTRIQLGLKQLNKSVLEKFNTLRKGDVLSGRVSAVTGYGIYVEIIKGLEGLIHFTQLSALKVPTKFHLRKRYIENFYTPGDAIVTKILSLDIDENKIVLSTKGLPLQNNSELLDSLVKGQIVRGIIVDINMHGVSVRLSNGILGFLKINEISWAKVPDSSYERKKYIKNILQLHRNIECIVLSIDCENIQVNLGLKQLNLDDYKKLIKNLKIWEIHTAKIIRIVDFGVFIQLNNGLEGLLHVSKILGKETPFNKERNIKEIKQKLCVGSQIDIVITKIDRNSGKLTFGIPKSHWKRL